MPAKAKKRPTFEELEEENEELRRYIDGELYFLYRALSEQGEEYRELNEKAHSLEKRNAYLEIINAELENELEESDLLQQIEELKTKIEELEGELKELETKNDKLERDLECVYTQEEVDEFLARENDEDYQKLYEKAQSLERRNEELEGELKELKTRKVEVLHRRKSL